jgi:glucose-1-phosphate adenylyltransferase
MTYPFCKPGATSRNTRNTLAIVLAGGRGKRLGDLTALRCKPAIPFGGGFRLIDFPLSNCLNSGIRRIGVLTQYMSETLIEHLQDGWSYLNRGFGEFVQILPAQQKNGPQWYDGTADAVYQNREFILRHSPEYVLILAADHVYAMHYGTMISELVETGADIVIATTEVNYDDAKRLSTLKCDKHRIVISFSAKPKYPDYAPTNPQMALASIGVYLFTTDVLLKLLEDDSKLLNSNHDFTYDVFPRAIKYGYRIIEYSIIDSPSAYWRDVGTVDAFWKANIELLQNDRKLDLYNRVWPIWTNVKQLPPSRFIYKDSEYPGAAFNSIVSDGCTINGAVVKNSVLMNSISIETDSIVKDSVILPDVRIGRNCHIEKAIIDSQTIIADNTSLTANMNNTIYSKSKEGIIIVTPFKI